ncbi:MAG TPA: hypothetical protein VMJ12_14470 [Candidatus Acidoferrales bacterium]|nr:hypothetical protein [Candidatus Acidoferrales bacterium]
MNNTLLRTFVVYAVCVVLAIWLGFLLAGPLTYSSLFIYGFSAFILVSPILLRWHFPLMFLFWNFAAVVPFIPGRPAVGVAMIGLSLGISVLQRMISSESRFISVPWMTLPLFWIIVVVAFTAKMNGFGLHVFGGEVYGGSKYVYLIGGVLGYFALSAKRIPPGRRNLYLALYFLGGVTAAVSDLSVFLPRSFYFIFYFFNANYFAFRLESPDLTPTRFSGAQMTSLAVFSFMLARYGLRGLFLSGKPWRWVFFVLATAYGLLGGYRGLVMTFALVFLIQFFLEGMHRTKLMAVFLSAGLFGALALIPLAPYLPFTFQRALSFLPYNFSTAAKLDAQGTLDWRLNMWQAVLPQIPPHLLLGKGYTINPLDYEFVMGPEASIRSTFAQNDPLALAEVYHNGPISVLIPFGIWGAIGFLWLVIAGLRLLYLNYCHADPDLKTINSFLLAAFATHVIMFLFIGGDFGTEMMAFCGVLGLSVSFNGGVRQRVRVIQPAREPERPRGFVPAPVSPAPAFHRQRPGPNR